MMEKEKAKHFRDLPFEDKAFYVLVLPFVTLLLFSICLFIVFATLDSFFPLKQVEGSSPVYYDSSSDTFLYESDEDFIPITTDNSEKR